MAWTVEWDKRAVKDLHKIDKVNASRIVEYMIERVACDDPRKLGKALTGIKAGLWSYRVGDYRIICELEDSRLVVYVVSAGHRRSVYKK